jgi:hypothetical protein
VDTRGDPDSSTARGVLDGVVDQVVKDLMEGFLGDSDAS